MTTAQDFTRWEEKARHMTVDALLYSVRDAAHAALAMDSLDRALGGDRAGRYRDECSVYRREINRRRQEGAST